MATRDRKAQHLRWIDPEEPEYDSEEDATVTVEKDPQPIQVLEIRALAGEEETVVGRIYGTLIRRDNKTIRRAFKESLSDQGHEDVALKLMDRYGRLERKWKVHESYKYESYKGSGIWGNEVDEGDLLIVEFIWVSEGPDERRCWIGHRLLRRFIQRAAEESTAFFTIALPVPLPITAVDHAGNPLQDTVRDPGAPVKLFRDYGFRRIGASPYFGYVRSLSHACHTLDAVDDYNPPKADRVSQDLAAHEELQHKDDAKCKRALVKLAKNTPLTFPSWRAVDKAGNNILHIASTQGKPLCVKWLMATPLGSDFLLTRNDSNETPLEATHSSLEHKRKQDPDSFRGYDAQYVSCLAELEEIKKPTKEQKAELSSGCICGQCISNILSPRMAHALRAAAEILFEYLGRRPHIKTPPQWCTAKNNFIQYLPAKAQEAMQRSYKRRDGYIFIFSIFEKVLAARMLPEPTYIKSLANQDHLDKHDKAALKEYFKAGGTLDAVANEIFREAMASDEIIGNGDYVRRRHNSAEVRTLGKCRNDGEWRCALGRIGYEVLV